MKTYKNKGVTLIELMVAVALGLILILSMLAFYSISSKNAADFQSANHDQQQIRKMLNLLETDIENTGGFECAEPELVYNYNNSTNTLRVPTNIISLGDKIERKQIVFVHPVIAEYQHTALGMFDFDKTSKDLKSYTPKLIKAGCGQDKSPVYIGSTILEMLPMNNIITTDTQYKAGAETKKVMAFVALSATQSRREKDSNDTAVLYTPNMNHATVMFLSDEENTNKISVGKNSVDMFLGFSPEGKNKTHVPEVLIHDDNDLKSGGWINPFLSDARYDLLVDKNLGTNNTPNPELLSQSIHLDAEGKAIKTYPLKPDLIKRVRAIKFQFTFGAFNGAPERKFTRVIRFKNTHLIKPGDL